MIVNLIFDKDGVLVTEKKKLLHLPRRGEACVLNFNSNRNVFRVKDVINLEKKVLVLLDKSNENLDRFLDMNKKNASIRIKV